MQICSNHVLKGWAGIGAKWSTWVFSSVDMNEQTLALTGASGSLIYAHSQQRADPKAADRSKNIPQFSATSDCFSCTAQRSPSSG